MRKLKELYGKYREALRYVIVGGLTTVVSLASYSLCVLTFLDPGDAVQLQIANVISWVCAVTFAYFANRKYVFESHNENKLAEAAKFVGARVSTLLIDMACMALFVSVLHWNDKLAKLLVQVIVFVLNYLFSKFFVFKREEGT